MLLEARRICFACCALAASAAVRASPLLLPVPVGQDVSLAGASSPRTVQATANNPAAPRIPEFAGFWFGLGAASAGYEAGDFDNLVEQVESFERDLALDRLSRSDAEALQQRANAFLGQLGRDGYVKLFASVQPPFLPLGGSSEFLDGSLTFGVVGISGARMMVLDDPVDVVEESPGNFRISSDTAAYGKGAAGVIASLGYSRAAHRKQDGALDLGGRLNYYTVELSRGVVALKNIADTSIDATQDAVEDEFDRGRRRTSAVGLDLGGLWRAQNLALGATVRNLNEPKFDFGPLGQNCTALTPAERRNCEAAAIFIAAGRIPALESYRMKRQLQLDGTLSTGERSVLLATTLDVNAARDATGDTYQWLSVGGAYAPPGWAPGLRLGYRHNLTGNNLDLLSFGLSLFRLVHFDVTSSIQMVDHDGHRRPRSALASLSFELPL